MKKSCLCLALALFSLNAQAERPQFWRQLESGFDSTGWSLLGGGALAAAIATRWDASVVNSFAGDAHLVGWRDLGNFWGGGLPMGVFALGAMGYGTFAPNEGWQTEGVSLTEGLLVNGAVSMAMKYAIGRTRPDESDKTSFPSGHTSTAFVMVGHVANLYGNLQALPFAALGVLTGLSRMASHKHFLSDTLFGASLGYFWGRTFAKDLQPHTGSTQALDLHVNPWCELSQRTCGFASQVHF